jgi:hypothetical protein
MSTLAKRILLGIAVLSVLLFSAFQFMKMQTKKISPESTVTYAQGSTSISVTYSRPYKKGRAIFGNLVPFGQVWRTGANEATLVTTSKNLIIGGKSLPAGKYTLWTIPESDVWTIIFNNKQYSWGVDFKTRPSREPEADVLQVKVPVQKVSPIVDQFTISFQNPPESALVLTWDDVKIVVPFTE